MGEKKAFYELQFPDAFMFAATMEDEEICRGVLERVMGIPIRAVKVIGEASMLVNPDYRGVRLDVYADDRAGSVYNVEMQTTNKKNLPRRSRFYQSQMDMVELKPGEEFNELPKSFIIFICTFDPFGHGLYRYTYMNRCSETGEELGDEAYKVFLNTKGKNDAEEAPELVRFLKYVDGAATAEESQSDELLSKIEARIAEIKQSRGMEVRYMLFSEMLSDERKEGRLEGLEEGRNKLLQLMNSMIADGDADKLPLLSKDAGFLQEMFEKYHIEA
ncbi:Rpn family recombination-promoting nuclease/putative transposase [Clostridium sp. AN503]|uniref:Rpn family recombination-promoting nuclease/putative transposase n=1 Tax=Clostridium sp. AN503 TaxID=3160598 RepID=UPI00345A9ECA